MESFLRPAGQFAPPPTLYPHPQPKTKCSRARILFLLEILSAHLHVPSNSLPIARREAYLLPWQLLAFCEFLLPPTSCHIPSRRVYLQYWGLNLESRASTARALPLNSTPSCVRMCECTHQEPEDTSFFPRPPCCHTGSLTVWLSGLG